MVDHALEPRKVGASVVQNLFSSRRLGRLTKRRHILGDPSGDGESTDLLSTIS